MANLEMIRIVTVISRMNVGGPAILIAELIGGLPREEFEHTLITGRCESNEIDFLQQNNLDTRVVYLEKIQRTILPINDFLAIFHLIRLLNKIKPDVIHTHTSKAGVIGRIAARIAAPKAKVIHTYHGHLLYGYFSNFKTSLIVLLEKFLSNFTNILVAVTQQVKSDLLRVGIGSKNEWSVIRPGLRKPNTLDKSLAKKQLGLAEGEFTIAWIGRFTNIKDPMSALYAVESMTNIFPNKVRLIMAGEGELIDQCRNYVISKNLPVSFLGWITDINPLLSAADLLLMSSKNEGMPVVIVEAALRGVPTLSTDVGGVREFIHENETGYLVDSPARIGEVLVKIATNISDLQKISRNAKELAESEFSYDQFIENHLKLYRDK